MRVMVTVPGHRRLRHLVIEAPEGASVAELHARLALPVPTGGAGPAEALRHGYAAGVARAGAQDGACSVRLVVASGPDAGGSVPLRPGRWVVVGRAASCHLTVLDPALSRQHVRVRHERHGVVVEDLGSTNGLRWEMPDPVPGEGDRTHRTDPPAGSPARPDVRWPTGATLKVGASRLALLLEPLPPAAGRDGQGRVLVTPWPRHLPGVAPVRLSTPAAPQARSVPAPSAWVWALPLVASLVVAVVLRMPMALLFGLMAPAMVVGHHLGERRAARRSHESAVRRHRVVADATSAAARRAVAEELATLRRTHQGLLGPVTSLLPWPTTALWSHAGEPPTVVLGEGLVRSSVELDGATLVHEAAPVVLDLSRPVCVVGPHDIRAAAVRSWVLQLACALPPSELGLVVDAAAPPGSEWDLLAWLPHTVPRTGAHRRVQVPWDRADGVLLVDDARDAPAGTAQVLIENGTTAVLRRPGLEDVPFAPTLLGLPLARHLARTLAALADARAADRAGPLTLGDLVPWPARDEEVRRGWARSEADLRAHLGTDDTGAAVVVDLTRDGPHALVAGTTGSGKSEVLRTLVTALALRNPPSRLGLLLIDYKGGSSLGECAALPHSSGLVTDLDPHLAERVLASLRAELRRREAALAAAGVRDVRGHGGDGLPRLLVVVDEFRVLAEELPEFLDGLVRLAAVGRSLGVHLVLATQRPAGVVSPDLRANVNLRIALRVRDAADSLDVLEVPDAAALPEGQPGRALLRTGAAPPRAVLVAPAAPPAFAARPALWSVDEVEGVWSGWAHLQRKGTTGPAELGLGGLPELLRRVATADGEDAPAVWRPPLGEALRSSTPGAWALADRPEVQRQDLLHWDARTHVGVAGAARTGRTTAATSLVGAAGEVWLYVVDPARGLERSGLQRHRGVRAWAGPHDPAHVLRVLEVVNEVVDERLARGPCPDAPPVVLVVDGWDRLEAYGDLGQGRARDLALRVLRDGAGAGVVAVLTGDRSLLTGAVAATLPDIWSLRLHDPVDLALTGLRRSQVPAHQPPGRAVRTRDGLVAQVLLPADRPPAAAPPADRAPQRVVSLPTCPADAHGWAVGGDEALDLGPPPLPFLVLGPPRSGVTTALAAVVAQIPGPVLRVDAGSPPDGEDLGGQLTAFSGTVVVDDAHLLAGSRTEELVLTWADRSHGRLVVGAELEASAALFRGLVPLVARHRTGLVLQPATAAHGSLLGVRVPVGDPAVPGRGVLVDRGRCTRVQVVQVSPGTVRSSDRLPDAP